MSKCFIVFPDKEQALDENGNTIAIGKVSDGYHSFDELYEHRCMLFIALMSAYPELSWKSRKHSDGSSYDGWFIAGMNLPAGQITYHLPNRLWDLTKVKELSCAPEYDGHTSKDVIRRLEVFIDAQNVRDGGEPSRPIKRIYGPMLGIQLFKKQRKAFNIVTGNPLKLRVYADLSNGIKYKEYILK